MTTPSAPPATAARTAVLIRSQSAVVSSELSTAIRSTTTTSRPEVRSVPLRLGRRTPSAPVLVDIVPPVVITVIRPIAEIIAHAPGRRGRTRPCRELGDDGQVSEEPTGSAEPVTSAGEAAT